MWRLLVLLLGMPALALASEPGITDSKPEQEPFVSLGDQYMIPYEERLPGSDITFRMMPVPGGEFLMGSPVAEAGRAAEEGPPRRVTLPPFWIAQCEVTWEEYQRFMAYYDIFKDAAQPITAEEEVDAVTSPTPLYDPTFTYALGEEPQQPAVSMSQYAARQYSKWLSKSTDRTYRLPSEAEWEYACRAGSTTAYPWGDDPSELEEYAWFYDNSDDTYHDVGQKKPNAWGLHDMHGNVAEFVLDKYAPYLEATDTLTLTEAIVWPDDLFGRTVRGGSWESDPPALRSAARSQDDDWRGEDPNLPKSPWWFTDEQSLCVGFRLVRQLEPPTKKQAAKFWDADVEELIEDVDFRVDEGRGVFGIPEPANPQPAK
ncbi:MAG: SUMF1/EgtB/PvdO family nonheme iron enzyme [Planctomycetota bacterium]